MGIYRKNRTWYIDYRFEGRRIRERIGRSKKAAKDALDTRKGEILQGRYNWAQKKKSPRFEALADEYLEYSKANKRSWKRDEASVGHLKPFFKGRKLTEVNPWMVEKYKQKRLEEGVKPATVNRELSCLKHMFNLAVRWGRLPASPLGKVKQLREENQVERILSPEEEIKLLAAANEPLRTIILVALNTGMRRGEILKLTWSCVDFHQSAITIVNPKNGKMRKVPMNETAVKVLAARKKMNGASSFVFFDVKSLKPWESVKTAFLASIRRAEIARLRFHDLRHTFATRLVARGVDILTVKELLGHSNVGMTMRYAHPSKENMRRAVQMLSGDGHQMDTKASKATNAVRVSI
jgi:site-specific recombinase XerD